MDSGGGSTTAAPVHDGYVLQKAVATSPIGGELLTDCMLKSLEQKGVSVKPRYALDQPPNQDVGAIRPPHGVLDQPTHVTRPPRPTSRLRSHVGSLQGIPRTGSLAAFGTDGSQVGVSGKNVLPSTVLAPKMSVSSAFSQSASSIPNSPASTNSLVGKENSRPPSAAGNGFPSDPVFGDVFSAAPSQPTQNSATVSHSDFPAGTLTSSRDQLTVKQTAVALTPSAQVQSVQASGKVNQNVLVQVQTSSIDKIKKFVCPHCASSFDSVKGLNGHKKVHSSRYRSKEEFPCPQCDMVFSNFDGLSGHKKAHTKCPEGKNDFPCALCDQSFPTISGLNGHQNAHAKAHAKDGKRSEKVKVGSKEDLLRRLAEAEHRLAAVISLNEPDLQSFFFTD